MPPTLLPPYALEDEALLRECRQEALHSGGPGGQHRNKTASAVRLVHLATGAEAQSHDHRERLSNRAEALARLRVRLACLVRGASDPQWLAPYRRGRQLRLGAHARDYARACACALDALAACDGSLPQAGAALGISSSQLAKLLGADPEARAAGDRLRAAHGLGPIHG